MVHDKILRTIGNMRKVSKQYETIRGENQAFVDKINENRASIESSMKKKNMLAMICDQFLKQNYELYLKHETMLDEENEKRHKLAEEFQSKMSLLQEEINVHKEGRQKAYDENQAIRLQIQKAIDDYKVREENYRGKMEEFNKEVQKVQDNLQEELKTGEMGKIQKSVDKEKAAYERTISNIKRLSDDINGYVKKFDNVKEEIDTSNRKYENYKLEIETKRQQISLLETQIQNIMLLGQLKEKTQ